MVTAFPVTTLLLSDSENLQYRLHYADAAKILPSAPTVATDRATLEDLRRVQVSCTARFRVIDSHISYQLAPRRRQPPVHSRPMPVSTAVMLQRCYMDRFLLTRYVTTGNRETEGRSRFSVICSLQKLGAAYLHTQIVEEIQPHNKVRGRGLRDQAFRCLWCEY